MAQLYSLTEWSLFFSSFSIFLHHAQLINYIKVFWNKLGYKFQMNKLLPLFCVVAKSIYHVESHCQQAYAVPCLFRSCTDTCPCSTIFSTERVAYLHSLDCWVRYLPIGLWKCVFAVLILSEVHLKMEYIFVTTKMWRDGHAEWSTIWENMGNKVTMYVVLLCQAKMHHIKTEPVRQTDAAHAFYAIP